MPPQALVLVEFPLDNPPQDVGLESDFARQHEAVYYHRVDQTDPDADYNASHGTDLWVMSMAGLGNFWQEIQRVWSARAAASELAFRRYAMNAPYYRDLFREYDFQVNVILRWKLVYGDERADLTILPGSENEDTVPIYYNQSGNKLLREALNTGLHMRMLDGLLGIIAM